MDTAIVLFWIGCGVACALIAGKKGYSPGGWLVLGILLSAIAVLVLLMLPDRSGQAGDQQ